MSICVIRRRYELFMKKYSPRFAFWLLSRFRNKTDHESLFGDYVEMYSLDSEEYGAHWARIRLWLQVLKALPVFFKNSIYWSLVMVRNYFKITIRHFYKNKGFTFINLTGLAMGISACLLIISFVWNEMSYDQFHQKKDRIFRLNKIVTPTTGETELHAITSGNMGPALTMDFPEVEQSLRLLPWFGDILMFRDEQKLKISDVVFTDKNFFEFFDFKLLEGNAKTVLEKPQSIVLSEETSKKFFGDENPVGQTIIGYRNLPYQITGVIENSVKNTHFRYSALISWSSTVPGVGALNMTWLNNWITQANYTYLMLSSKQSNKTLLPKLVDFMKKYMPTRTEQYQLYFQPLTDIHLKSTNLQYSRNLNLGNILYVYIFSGTAFLILFIACINFVNLSTAQASKRSREVGVRKVMGAVRRQLSIQFLGESLLLSILAMFIAILFVKWSIPIFERFTGYEFHFDLFSNGFFILMLIGLTFLVGLFSGTYPSLVLSRFNPIRVLNGSWNGDKGSKLPRQILVTTQFSISIILILGTLMIFRQMNYVQTKNMGFKKDQIVVLPIGITEISEKHVTFKQEILQDPEIKNVAGSQSVPGSGTMSFSLLPEGKLELENWQAEIYPVDYDFLQTYKMEMAEGRYFSKEFTTDAKEAVIINQTLQKSLGWQNPVGKRLDVSGETTNSKVIGVIKDFNFESLHHSVSPLVLFISPKRTDYLSLQITGNNVQSTLKFLEEKWLSFESKYPFEYYFLDKEFENFYLSEKRMMQTLGLFSSIAILIACLGILGLVSFTVEQKTKEIGIRKILGASASKIVVLLSKDFLLLVSIALIVASPVAYYFIQKWLQGFAYQTPINLWIFFWAGSIAFFISILTISTQAIRAALKNPAETLRYE